MWTGMRSPCACARLVRDHAEAAVAVGKGWKCWGDLRCARGV